jgi:SAM-dependent methyltransferase
VPLTLHRLRTLDDYLTFRSREAPALARHRAELERLLPKVPSDFKVDGYSYTAGCQVSFEVDFKYNGGSGGVNWRERVCCPLTGFANRSRATVHVFDMEMEVYPDSEIYLMEQTSPLYLFLKARFSRLVGSEHLGEEVPLGGLNSSGLRNEDATRLSFKTESLDAVVSLDVFEHVPDFVTAFRECARVLRPGGRMLWSVPFINAGASNLIRARLLSGGTEYLEPPEYHADPISPHGVLCYQHFGWEMLQQMRSAGFRDAYAVCYFSREFGYLGGEQFLFLACK